ncbi:MAG: metallophosphoesterase, partial [Anaerolineae bacterium]|nr:metallophosphoesterase [Anaerolineae bacterium]
MGKSHKDDILTRLKIAVFSDIHGNFDALQAVLDDIQRKGGVEAIWIAGDLAAFGHAPVKTLDRLAHLDLAT